MYGYIRPVERELRLRESEYYRALYCGICRAQGRQCGNISRLSLSYDSVFLALLRIAVTGEHIKISQIRCPRHPLRRRTAADCAAADASALVCTILAREKARDDTADEKGFRRAAAKAAGAFLSGAEKRASALCAEAADAIFCGLRELFEAERRCLGDNTAGVDQLAGIFGRMLGSAAAAGLEGNAAKIVRGAAAAAGRWLYCIDTVDDLAEDKRRGRFNPLLLLYGRDWLSEEEALTLSCTLSAELDTARAALELADRENRTSAPEAWAICENILTLGMPLAAARAIDKITRKPDREQHPDGNTVQGVQDV